MSGTDGRNAPESVADFIKVSILPAKSTKNNVLQIVMESIMAAVRENLSRLPPDFETSKFAVQRHEEILKAILNRKRNEAHRILGQLILEIDKKSQAVLNKISQSR
jgi:DNA-binding FadR family transcriptional regulator